MNKTDYVIKLDPYRDIRMITFYHQFFDAIRTAVVGDGCWFVGTDVAKGLKASNPEKYIRYHVYREDRVLPSDKTIKFTSGKVCAVPTDRIYDDYGNITFPYIIDSLGRIRRPVWINAKGLRAMITGRNNMRGKTIGDGGDSPDIKKFKIWVTGVILPEIREYTGYSVRDYINIEDTLNRYKYNRAIDSDGFIRLLPTSGGRYDAWIRNRIASKAVEDHCYRILHGIL